MQLTERLNKLVGHEVLVIPAVKVEGGGDLIGTLSETGPDYLVIQRLYDIPGIPQTGAQCVLNRDSIVGVAHTVGCDYCQNEINYKPDTEAECDPSQ